MTYDPDNWVQTSGVLIRPRDDGAFDVYSSDGRKTVHADALTEEMRRAVHRSNKHRVDVPAQLRFAAELRELMERYDAELWFGCDELGPTVNLRVLGAHGAVQEAVLVSRHKFKAEDIP